MSSMTKVVVVVVGKRVGRSLAETPPRQTLRISLTV